MKQSSIEWEGHISVNEIYGAGVRKNIGAKKVWKEKFAWLVHLAKMPVFGVYRLKLEYNSRLDPTNTFAMIKMAEDMMRAGGVMADDTKKYCKGIEVVPDSRMKSKSYRLTIIEVDETTC